MSSLTCSNLYEYSQDPPGYFEHVIWPGYVQAHKALFEGGDVEKGQLVQPSEENAGDGAAIKNLVLFESESMSLQEIVDITGKEVERGIEAKS
jgi:nicotinamide/nicotinate riboside kinase